MKGIILAELAEYAAATFPTAADAAAARSYDARAVYSRGELVELAERLGEAAAVTPAELLRDFGVHLFARFAALYPVFFVEVESAIPFLVEINGYVHGEVQKIYPDAQLPRFDCARTADGGLEMTYLSDRELPDLAEGLIRGCIAHFGDPIEVRRESVPGSRAGSVRFLLRPGPRNA
jgi:hypothetical protein